MGWFVAMQVFSILLEWLHLGRRSAPEKDLEILLLRHQIAIWERQHQTVVRPSRGEKFILAVLTVHLKTITQCTIKELSSIIRIVQPETALKWHRELVRRKWSQRPSSSGGRPRTDPALEKLIIRLAQENDWGHLKIAGELLKLGYVISDETVATILKRHGIPPLSERKPSLSWRHFMMHYKDQLLACDFFTVETLFLQTAYVLFFIELGSRRVHFAGCTLHPNNRWVTQQARQMVWELEDTAPKPRFLIHDRDTKFSQAFDHVFESVGVEVIRTPVCAPNANAFAERWVRTVREECLDKLIIVNQAHLHHVMLEFTDYYNTARPHQGLHQRIPRPKALLKTDGFIHRRSILGGIIHDYYREAA